MYMYMYIYTCSLSSEQLKLVIIVCAHIYMPFNVTLTANSMDPLESLASSNSLLYCGICFEKFGKNRQPRVLPCTHVFCQICLTIQAKDHRGIITCAECREESNIECKEVEKLKLCRTTMRLLEQDHTERERKAAKCQMQKADSTTAVNGRQRALEIQGLLSSLRDSIRDVTQSGKIFEVTINTIRSERALLSQTLETAKQTIKSKTEDIAKATSKRRRELLEELDKAYEESLALLTAQEEVFKTEKEAHERFCSEKSKREEAFRKDGQAPREDLERLIKETQSKDGSLQHKVLVPLKRLSLDNDSDRYMTILNDVSSWGVLQQESCTLEVPPVNPQMHSNLEATNPHEGGFSHYVDKNEAVRTLGYEPGTMLSSPSCVTELPNGDIAVASSMSYEISIFASPQQRRVIHLEVPQGGFFREGITGMCTTPTGRLCVSNPDMNTVHIMTLDGVTQYQFQLQTSAYDLDFFPRGLASNPKGEVFVCDWANHLVRVFDPSGQEVRRFGGRGKEAGKLSHPSDLALTPDGEVVVADYGNDRIQVFDGTTGTYQATFGSTGCKPNQLKGPVGIAIDSQGFVAVVEKHNNRVQLFTSRGKSFQILGKLKNGDNIFHSPKGIAITSGKEIVVCDSKNDRVQIF